MASDATTAQRLLSSNKPALPAAPSTSPQPLVALVARPGDTGRPTVPLPRRIKNNKPKHWINVRNLPQEHPTELYPAPPGYAQPLA